MVKTAPFDAADYLDNPEVIVCYISEALETEDPAQSAPSPAFGA
jgi:DNA-binding phage protein